MSCKPFVCEFLNEFHSYHLGLMIAKEFKFVNNILMFIINFLLLHLIEKKLVTISQNLLI